MAEFELQMKYSTPPMKAGMYLCALLIPVWGVTIPTITALFIVLLLRLPADIPILYCLGLIAIALTISLSFLACALICDDNQIRITKDGLTFPLRFWPALKFQHHQNWQELGALKLHWNRKNSFAKEETLTLFFRGGAQAQLELRTLQAKELEQFFIAFESCATKCDRDAELPDFEHALQTKQIGSSISFTELWEKSLSNRFSGATFTPLDPETTLQDGDYKIIKQLSFGGFAATYLARTADGKFILLKESCFTQTEELQSKATKLFQREAAILGQLSDPHIARLLDYFLENDRHYLVTEYFEGTDLNQLVLQRGPLSPETIVELIRQAATALAHIHEQSPPVVHKDVAPENLILRQDGTLILSNFGAAKEIVEGFTGTITGKQSYVAPEQFKGQPTNKSDIYGLGTTIFYLITGAQPEPLANSTIHIRAVEDGPGETDSNSNRLKMLSKIVAATTSQNENDRPDARSILSMLENLRAMETVAMEAVAISPQAVAEDPTSASVVSPQSTEVKPQ